MYTLQPKIAAAIFSKRGADHVSNQPNMPRALHFRIGNGYSDALLNHLQILPRLSMEGLSSKEVKDEAYRMIMSSFLKAIKRNCFEEDDLKNLKKAFP
jgi:hypothetical protein